MTEGVEPTNYLSLGKGAPQVVDGELAQEVLACISVNGQEIANFMCSPHDLDILALGFLYNEGLIESLDEVASLHVSAKNTCVDIWLHATDFEKPDRSIITTGCGGGITFDDLSERHDPLESSLQATPDQLAKLMRQLHLGAKLYQRSRGIHTAVLADHQSILLQVEDIGRHNCIDKLCGAALKAGISTKDRILVSSGRISSEMINKARRLETPILCSRTSPTSLSVALAKTWQMTIVAYLRQNRMRIYSYPERITNDKGVPISENGHSSRKTTSLR